MGQVPITLPEGLAELRTILEAEWPARQAALRASGALLNDGEGEGAGEGEGDGGEGAGEGEGAGVEDDLGGDGFDRDRALATIKKQRESEKAALKKARDLEAKVREFEDASKTDQQKMQEERDQLRGKVAPLEAENARLRVALKKGLTLTQAKRLVGETEEELEVDADELVASFGDGGSGGTRRRPAERLRPGASPSSEPEETDPDKLAAKVPRMYG